MLRSAPTLAIEGVDTAETDPSKVSLGKRVVRPRCASAPPARPASIHRKIARWVCCLEGNLKNTQEDLARGPQVLTEVWRAPCLATVPAEGFYPRMNEVKYSVSVGPTRWQQAIAAHLGFHDGDSKPPRIFEFTMVAAGHHKSSRSWRVQKCITPPRPCGINR